MTTLPLHALGGLSVEEVSPGEFQLVVKVNGLSISNELEIKNDTGNPVAVKGDVFRIAASFGRPADTIAYAFGDLVANSTTAGSVVPMPFVLGMSKGLIRSAKFKTSNATLASGATFRLHLWSQAPTVTGGDNAAVFATAAGLATSAGYLGYVDCTADVWFSDGSEGRGYPSPDIHFDLGTGSTVYGLLEARGAITPASGATITCTLAGLAA